MPKLPSHRNQSIDLLSKKGVFRNFTKFIGKHLCQSLLFNKVSGLRTATLLKRRLRHRCFPVNLAKFLKNTFFTEHLRTTASDSSAMQNISEKCTWHILTFFDVKDIYQKEIYVFVFVWRIKYLQKKIKRIFKKIIV